MSLTYIRHIPAPPLDAYIDFLYYGKGFAFPREKILPMRSPNLVICFSGGLQVYDSCGVESLASLTESWVTGTWSDSIIAQWPPDCEFFGVRFKPGEAYPFFQLPFSELHNQFVALDMVWGHSAAEIRERLYAAPSIQVGFALLEQFLLARLGEAPHGLDVVRYGVGEIARLHGSLSIQALSDRIGISQNHLLTQFKRMVGTSPKELARLYRFEHVLRTIDPTQPVNWTQIAHQAGYADQSHLIKDFVAFTGHSPTDYLRLHRRLGTENPQRSEHLRSLPTD